MDFEWEWIDERVGTVVDAPAFGGELEVVADVERDVLEALGFDADLAAVVPPEQVASLRAFVESEAAIFAELKHGLVEMVLAADAQRQEWYDRRAERAEAEERREAKKNLPYGWGDDPDPWEEEDDDDVYAAELFDDPAPEDRRRGEPEPPATGFAVTRLHIARPDRRGGCVWRFVGDCDWDEEHGLDVDWPAAETADWVRAD